MPLVSMGIFSNDIPLLDAIVNLFDNENSIVTMMVHGKPISFSVKPSNVHKLNGLSYKDDEEPINTKVTLLNDKDKIHLGINYGIQEECLTGEIIFSLSSVVLIYFDFNK